MRRQPLMIVTAVLGIAAVVAIGVAQAPKAPAGRDLGPAPTPAQVKADLAGSPPALASLHSQGGMLLAGGARAMHARLASLRGYPVVLNKWASWCVPCRAEFPVYQRVAAAMGRRVAFVGIDSGDYGDAGAFLSKYPVSYPSYVDRSGSLGTALTQSTALPVTVFYDAAGRSFIHEGGFTTVAQLEIDIRRYALDERVGASS